MSFKVGDKVVVISNDSYFTAENLYNATITLYKIDEEHGYDFIGKSITDRVVHVYTNEIVLEEVYNSPLYKTLKEEE